jgi:hypothetical protein
MDATRTNVRTAEADTGTRIEGETWAFRTIFERSNCIKNLHSLEDQVSRSGAVDSSKNEVSQQNICENPMKTQ